MRKVTIGVIGMAAVLTFIVIGAVQVGHVGAKSDAVLNLIAFQRVAIVQSTTLNQDKLDDVVAVLHSDPPTANVSRSNGFGYGFGIPYSNFGNGAFGSGGTTPTLCSVNWEHGSGLYAWHGYVAVSWGDCETNQSVTRIILSLDSSSIQSLTLGDLIEAFGAPIAAERPSFRSCFNRVRASVSSANGTTRPTVNVYSVAPSLYLPSVQLYFENGFSATVPCYAGIQTTLNLEAPIRAVTYTAPLPTTSSAPFSYAEAQWHGLTAPSLYYAMCSATDDPRCQGRRLPRGGQNGFYFTPGATPPTLFPTLVPPGP